MSCRYDKTSFPSEKDYVVRHSFALLLRLTLWFLFYSTSDFVFVTLQKDVQGHKEFLISLDAEKEQLADSWVTLLFIPNNLSLYLFYWATFSAAVTGEEFLQYVRQHGFPPSYLLQDWEVSCCQHLPSVFQNLFQSNKPSQCGRCSLRECLNHRNISSRL